MGEIIPFDENDSRCMTHVDVDNRSDNLARNISMVANESDRIKSVVMFIKGHDGNHYVEMLGEGANRGDIVYLVEQLKVQLLEQNYSLASFVHGDIIE